MSQVKIKRLERDVAITLTTATGTANTLRLEDMAGAVVTFGTMSTNAASLQMWVATAAEASFSRLYNTDGSAADITLSPSSTQGRAYALPDAVFPVPWLKILAGTTNSVGTVGFVSFKS